MVKENQENKEKKVQTDEFGTPMGRIRGIRLIVFGISIFLIIFVVIRIFLLESKDFTPLLINSTAMFIALWVVIILFSLTFLFILIRNIIKLYYDREQEYSGGRFKKRLMFFFISFSIVPTLLLFIFGTDLINSGIDKWFRPEIDSIMHKIEDLNQSYYEKAKDDLKHFSKTMVDDKKGIKNMRMHTEANRIFLINYVKSQMINYQLDVVNIFKNSKEILSRFKPDIPLQEYKDLTLEDVYKGLSASDFIRVDTLKQGELIRSGITFDTKEGDKVLVVIGKYFPEMYIKNLQELNDMVRQYGQHKTIKDPVKTTYMLLFIFITILIIFSASWLGLYLAKGITVPIEKVVAAASEIASGNLDVQIDYSAKDEFNILINEFNTMVSDLKENRNKLHKRTMELRQRKSMTENILKTITSGVIALNSKGEILDINPSAEGMLSINIKTALDKHFSEILHENPYKDLNKLIDKAFTSKFKLLEKEVDIKTKGKILKLAAKIVQIKNPVNNKFSGIMVVLTDMTELMRAQRMLVWREVAKRIAHEIKNPLTPITISSQRILRSMELPEAEFRKIVEDSLVIIQQELESIKNLADEFSNFARLPMMKFTKGDINEVLEKLVSVYSSIYNQIEFDIHLDVNIPISVKMDYEQMKRIFVNIFDNAIESMEEKGNLEIKSRYDKGSQFVIIEIADDGPGISDEDKQKLFIPYFSKKKTGTGLGLAIAHNVIDEHNGLISIVDNSPQGARFIIEIPA